ncbi:flagellar hook-length control protein FliK [Arvimicrobium flavum]|uniref:flagellar hook-length control protein FliK n=1 Tax=Arvimicrobium flavum TaxID=3393320 RepID=UPI00237B1EA4|nr:flagellar hook-length control protein FliK [Mesorhizobium shangrilense]
MNPLMVPKFIAPSQPKSVSAHAGTRGDDGASSFDSALHSHGDRREARGRGIAATEQNEPMRKLAAHLASSGEREPPPLADEATASEPEPRTGDKLGEADESQSARHTDDEDAGSIVLHGAAELEAAAQVRTAPDDARNARAADARTGNSVSSGETQVALRRERAGAETAKQAAGSSREAGSAHNQMPADRGLSSSDTPQAKDAQPLRESTPAASRATDGAAVVGQPVAVLEADAEPAPNARVAAGIAAMLGDSRTDARPERDAAAPHAARPADARSSEPASEPVVNSRQRPDIDPAGNLKPAPAVERIGPSEGYSPAVRPGGAVRMDVFGAAVALTPQQAAEAFVALGAGATRLSAGGAGQTGAASELESASATREPHGSEPTTMETKRVQATQPSPDEQADIRSGTQSRDRDEAPAPSGAADRSAARAAELPLTPMRSAPTVASIVEPFLASSPVARTGAASLPEAETVSSAPHSLKIQLRPIELGVVTATLRMAGDTLTVEMMPENIEAYERLNLDSDAIVKALRGIGLQVDQVTVQQPQVANPKPENGSPTPSSGGQQQQFSEAGGSSGHSSEDRRGSSSNGGTQNGVQAGPASSPAHEARSGSGLFI